MKKIISLGIASAVLAMTAISASAGVVVKTDSAVTPGATITVQFIADADVSSISFKTAATGATLVSAAKGVNADSPLVVIGDKNDSYVSLAGAKANDVLMTQTYTVTAAEGADVAVNVTDLEGTTGVQNLTVKVTTTSTPDTSSSDSSSSDTSSETPSTSDSSSETPSTSDSKPSSGDNNPGTGVALAVFPAVIAGAAVVVAKKKRG